MRIAGQAPLAATVYELERLRCNACGQVFTAEEPEGVGPDKYDETALSNDCAAQVRQRGSPLYRLESLEHQLLRRRLSKTSVLTLTPLRFSSSMAHALPRVTRTVVSFCSILGSLLSNAPQLIDYLRDAPRREPCSRHAAPSGSPGGKQNCACPVKISASLVNRSHRRMRAADPIR